MAGVAEHFCPDGVKRQCRVHPGGALRLPGMRPTPKNVLAHLIMASGQRETGVLGRRGSV